LDLTAEEVAIITAQAEEIYAEKLALEKRQKKTRARAFLSHPKGFNIHTGKPNLGWTRPRNPPTVVEGMETDYVLIPGRNTQPLEYTVEQVGKRPGVRRPSTVLRIPAYRSPIADRTRLRRERINSESLKTILFK